MVMRTVKTACLILALLFGGMAALSAATWRALVLTLEDRLVPHSALLVAGLGQGGYVVSQARPRDMDALVAAIRTQQDKLTAGDGFLVYILGSAAHHAESSVLVLPGGQMERLWAAFDPRLRDVPPVLNAVVLDVCRAGPFNPKSGWTPGLGPLLQVPPGVMALVPAQAGFYLSPDDDIQAVIAKTVLPELLRPGSGLLQRLDGAVRALQATGNDRIKPWLASGMILENDGGTARIYGIAPGMTLAEVESRLGLGRPGPDQVYQLKGDGLVQDARWEAPGANGTRSLLLTLPGWFQKTANAAAPRLVEHWTGLQIYFDAKEKVSSLGYYISMVGSGGFAMDQAMQLAALSWAASMSRILPEWQVRSEPDLRIQGAFVSATVGGGETAEIYMENVNKTALEASRQFKSLEAQVRLRTTGSAVGDAAKIDYYGETVLQCTLGPLAKQ